MEFLKSEFGIFLLSYLLTILLSMLNIVKHQQKELKIYLIQRFGARYRLITFMGMMLMVISLPTLLSYLKVPNMATAMPMGFALALYVSLNRTVIKEEDLSQE